MNGLVKVWRLPAGEQRLLFQALLALLVARLALWISTLKKIQSFKLLKVSGTLRGSIPPEKIVWAIGALGRRLPGLRNCLVQALAGQMLLARYGQASQLRIGVARFADGQFKAHAWVEVAGRILIGGGGVSQFTVFPSLEPHHDRP
jgi:hypothetical protein